MARSLKKFFILLLGALFAVTLAFAVAACADGAEVTVTFDANGGAFGGGEATYAVSGAAGDDLNPPANPAREHFDFLGWADAADGAPVEVPAQIPEANRTFYAVWKAEGEVAVTFDANGGVFSGNRASVILTGKPGDVLVQPQSPTRGGFRFSAWSTTKTGTLGSVPFAFPDHDMTFYAVWDEDVPQGYTLTLRYGVNGNSVGERVTRVPGVVSGSSLAPQLAGVDPSSGDSEVVFDGWYYVDGSKVQEGDNMPTRNLELRARYTVSFTLNVSTQETDGETYGALVTTTETGFFGESYTYAAPLGFEVDARHEGTRYTVSSLGKGETFTVYLARMRYTLTFLFTGDGVNESRYPVSLPYGAEYTLPRLHETEMGDALPDSLYAFSYEIDGASHRAGETYTVQGNATVRAELVTAKRDVFDGDDYLFVDGSEAFLRRGAFERMGTYDRTTGVFRFEDGGKEILGGVALNEKFYFFNDTTEKDYVDYHGSAAMMHFGYHNEASYTPAGAAQSVSGTLTVDEETGRYTFEAADTDPVEFVLDVTDGGDACYRTVSEREIGTFARVEDRGAPDDYGYIVLVFDGFGFVTEFYDPSLADSSDEAEREFYAEYNGSVGKYFRNTAWGNAEYYTISFADGTGYSVELERKDRLPSLDSRRLDGVWYAYDGMLGEGDYLVGIPIAGGRAAGFGAGVTANYASLIVDGFGNALLDTRAEFDETNCTYDDLHWTGTYVLRSDIIYGYGLDDLGLYPSFTEVDWIEYTDSETGKTTLYSFESSYRTYSVMTSAPKRYYVSEEDLSFFGESTVTAVYYGARTYFTEVFLYDVNGDASAFYIYGRGDEPIWSQQLGRELYTFYEPIEAGAATLANGVYTFTSSSQTPSIASMRFRLTANGDGTMTADIITNNTGDVGEIGEQIITDPKTGEQFRINDLNEAFYRASEGAEEVAITAHRDTLGEEENDFDTGEDYAVWREGFYRFDLPDGTTAYFSYHIEDSGDVTYERIEEPTIYTLSSATYLNRPATEVYFYKTDDGKYYLGYMPDDGYTFWAGTVTPLDGVEGAYTFVMQETFRETFEYYTGLSTDNLRFLLSEDDHTFVLYDEALTATDPLTETTMSTDGFGTLTLTAGEEVTEYPYAIRVLEDDFAVLVYATFDEEHQNDDGLTIGRAHEQYIVVDRANDTFMFGTDDAGVYYATTLSAGGIGMANRAFELDGDGKVIFSEPNVADRNGTYEATGTLKIEDTMLGLLGLEYDLTIYTFTFNGDAGEETMCVAAFHTNELTYVMDGETHLFVPIGFFFEQMPAATVDMDTEDGMGFVRSNGFVSNNMIAISDAVYDNGAHKYIGTLTRGTYLCDSYLMEERDFEYDAAGKMLFFEAYDEVTNELLTQFVFDIVEKDGAEVARLRTTQSGLFAETVGGDLTNDTLYLDGYGGATLTRDRQEIAGTVTPVEGEEGAYDFVSEDEDVKFRFGIFTLAVNSGEEVYAFVYANDLNEAGYFLHEDWSVLYLDEFFNGYYIDHKGVRSDGIYSFLSVDRDIISLTLADDSILYFNVDLDGGSFEVNLDEFIVDKDGTLLAYTGNGSISKFPDEVTRITRNSFAYGDYISAPGTMDLNMVEIIDTDAFHYVNLAASLISGPNVREIGDNAFRQEFFDFGEFGVYHSVSAFSFPKAESIGDYAFCGDYTVSSFVFGGALQSIGVNAFSVRQGLPVSLDLSAMTADELAAVTIGENAFRSYYLGEPTESITNATVYVKDVDTLVAFWKIAKWPEEIRNSATVHSTHEDDLDGYDFYSFSAKKYLSFAEGRVSFAGEDGSSEPQAMYFIEDSGDVKVIRRGADDTVTYVDLVRTDDIIKYEDAKYFRASDLMRGSTLHGAQLKEGVMFYFELLISRDIEGGTFEAHSVRGVYVNDRSEDGRIVPESYSYADGKLTVIFVYDGTQIDKGKYTVTVDLEGDTLTATYSMIEQRYVYNVEGTTYNRASYRVLADFAEGKITKIHMVENYNYYGLDPWDHFTVLAERVNSDGTHSVYAEGQRQNGYGVIGVFYTISYDADTGLITMVEKRDGSTMTGMVTVEYTTTGGEHEPYDRFTVYVISYKVGEETQYVFSVAYITHYEWNASRSRYESSRATFTVSEDSDYLTGKFTVTSGGKTYSIVTSQDEEGTWSITVTEVEG